MKFSLRLLPALVLSLTAIPFATAQESRSVSPSATASVSLPGGEDRGATVNDEGKKGGGGATASTPDNPPATDPSIADPLIRVLVKKGVLTTDEARTIGTSGTPAEQRDRLAALLRSKGLISDSEYEAVRTAAPVEEAAAPAQDTRQNPQNPKPAGPATTPQPAAPAVIAAVAPLRVLQFEPAKREGLIPDIRIGTGARLKLYGFFKASIVHDTSSPQGNDFPLPLLAQDTGPNLSPEFHVKVRAFRFGANFEWLDPAPKTSITGRLEFDFEGNFTRANNVNISSIRNSQPRIRLAWVRIDRKFSESTSGFALFGQDWTPFGSSTLPNLIETTGLGLAYGTLYTRTPQARLGINWKTPRYRALSFQPEFAIVMPAFGDLPADITTVAGGVTVPVPNQEGIGNQLGFGERQGPDSNRPEIEGRFVTQWQLDRAPSVVPAQLIFSFVHGHRRAIVPAGNVPLLANPPAGVATTVFRTAFPNGVEVDSTRNGWTAEIQLPTRFMTVVGKYYRGTDLRWFFAGQLLSNFDDLAGLTNVTRGFSVDGASTPAFGLAGGFPVVAPERPVRDQGGFLNVGFPLSRIFNANPKGRNAGWTAYLHYGIDEIPARDARRFNNGGARGTKSDLFAGNIQYKLNTWVTFALEESYYRTRSANSPGAGPLPLLRGIPSRQAHDIRSEFATIFTF